MLGWSVCSGLSAQSVCRKVPYHVKDFCSYWLSLSRSIILLGATKWWYSNCSILSYIFLECSKFQGSAILTYICISRHVLQRYTEWCTMVKQTWEILHVVYSWLSAMYNIFKKSCSKEICKFEQSKFHWLNLVSYYFWVIPVWKILSTWLPFHYLNVSMSKTESAISLSKKDFLFLSFCLN